MTDKYLNNNRKTIKNSKTNEEIDTVLNEICGDGVNVE